jgi:hypothetical protein
VELIIGLGLLGYALLYSSENTLINDKQIYKEKTNIDDYHTHYLNNYTVDFLENDRSKINDNLNKLYKESIKPNSKIVNNQWRYETYYDKNKKNEINNLLTNDIGMIKNKNYFINNNIETMKNIENTEHTEHTEQSDSVFSDDYQSFNYKSIKPNKYSNRHTNNYSDNETSYQSDNETNINIKTLNSQQKFMDDIITEDNISVYNKQNPKCNINRMQQDTKPRCENQYLDQYDQLKFGHNGLPEGFNNMKPEINIWNKERPIEQSPQSIFNPNEDGRYGVTTDMTHGNMQPFFGTKEKGYNPMMDEKKAQIFTRNVELFTGSDQNLQFKHKQETKNLFSPEMNRVESITGVPNFTNFFESRYIPSDKRQGERPFEPIRVTPGLNLGYNQNGNTGRQDLYRVLPKTVDQLRTVTKPKVSYAQPIIPGQKGERRGVIGDMIQKTPDRFFYQAPDSMMPNTGPLEAPTIYGKYLAPQTNRAIDSNTIHINPAKDIDRNAPKYLREGEYTAPTKINYLHAGPRNVEYNTRSQNVNKESFNNVQTQRATTGDYTHLIGTVGNHTTMPLINFLNYVPETTLKQLVLEDNGRKNLSNVSNSLKSYLFNSINSIKDMTLRDIISENIKITNQRGNYENGYLFNTQNATTDQNMRNLSQDNVIITTISNAEKGYLYNNLNAIPDTNLRQLVNTLWGSGGLNIDGNQKTNQMFNYQNGIPNTTLKETTENLINITNVSGSQMQNYLINNENAIPDQTLKQLTENKKYLIGQQGNYTNNYIFNYENGIPDQTLRNIIGDVVQISNIDGNHKTGYLINYINAIPDETLKQITENKKYLLNITPIQMKNYLINYLNSIPETTTKELTENQQYLTGQKGNRTNQYAFNYIESIPETTTKELTENQKYLMGQKGNKTNQYAFNYIESIPETTIKELTENQKYLTGQKGNRTNQYAFNYIESIPDKTIREMTEEIKYLTNILGNHKKGISFNYENGIPETTLKEHMEKTKNLIGVGNKFINQGFLYNYDEKAKNTLREMTEKLKHLSNVAFNKYQGKMFNWSDVPDQTNRAMTETTKNIIGSVGNKQFQRSRLDANNALLNTEKEVVAQGRDPVPVKDNRGPTPFFTEYVFCNDKEIERPQFMNVKPNTQIKNELFFG